MHKFLGQKVQIAAKIQQKCTMKMRLQIVTLENENTGKMENNWKIFAYIKKKQYLCSGFGYMKVTL